MSNTHLYEKLINAIVNSSDESVMEADDIIKKLSISKVRAKMGITEDVRIEAGNVLVKGSKVGTVTIDENDSVVFNKIDGSTETYDSVSELYTAVGGLNEAEVSTKFTYTTIDPRSKQKDSIQDKMKKTGHDHGLDDPSGLDQKKFKAKDAGKLPEDKKHKLKDFLHSDNRFKGKKHNYDDPTSDKVVKDKPTGSLPEDKKDDVRKKHNSKGAPTSKDHGHDDKSGVGKVVEALESGQYQTVVFFQEHQAEEALDILEKEGPDAAIKYLSNWDDGDGEVKYGDIPRHRGYSRHELGNYVLVYNTALQHIGLYHILD